MRAEAIRHSNGGQVRRYRGCGPVEEPDDQVTRHGLLYDD